MTRVLYTPRARRDLIGIVETIARDSPRAAEAFRLGLEHHCSLLSTTPRMGRERPEIGTNIRSLVEGNYLIFYRFDLDADQVEILRVWHGRRRLPRIGQ
jgi:toxin ParE1/3/4